MTKHLLNHLKQNTIAYFALFVALGGTSYASVKLPQVIHAQQAAKSAKAGITCGGRCPATKVYWAYAAGSGVIPGGGAFTGPVYQTAVGGYPASLVKQGVGDWLVFFQNQDLSNCARFANLVRDRGSASVAGYDSSNPNPNAIHVLTTNAAGQPADVDFVVLALCGATKGLTITPAPPAAGAK
jgi:hypothetical protein